MKTPNKHHTKNNIKSYTQYSSMGFQMIGIIGLLAYVGYKIDENTAAQTPIYTAIFSLMGVCISLYTVIKSLKKPSK
ncbi:MAG: AtpZ/AtpI family protein [Sphingobacteriales bacterium]|nr:MAG: AtpZ/AtpI family protein [Sphingobacteriales bacterium]TAF79372.1 MAG: AtpZ/AtpI family protein [Sphingobacteriales bacterium]